MVNTDIKIFELEECLPIIKKEYYIDEEYYKLNEPRIRTVAEWELILKNELEINKGFDFITKVLLEMYKLPDYTAFCSDLEEHIGLGGINLRVGEFRDRIKKIEGISIIPQIREDTGTDRAWNIPFKTSERINILEENRGKFCWILREELVEAMENVMPYIKTYRGELSKGYVPIEYYDNAILDKDVEYIDTKELLKEAKEKDKLEEYFGITKYPKKIDYINKQIRNKMIGDSGECKVVQLEKERLKKINRSDLARQVHIVESDAYGYDVVSFSEDGKEKHIEVKTSTNSTDDVSFYISAHEISTLLKDDTYELHYLYNVKGDVVKHIVFTNQQLRNEIISKYLIPTQFEVNIIKEK